ncbi:hypothetical protein GCM10008023_26590 [Sphingomonas glacialis]|uniref:Uncharacterized protein n=1 Tax=Sphingomonas glacialis TaxID=658225 RepID=A0ABQ3LL14_9SPHN|nr:hypothetical protein GCM10008023_26590 [Sphingomonas glacialis]
MIFFGKAQCVRCVTPIEEIWPGLGHATGDTPLSSATRIAFSPSISAEHNQGALETVVEGVPDLALRERPSAECAHLRQHHATTSLYGEDAGQVANETVGTNSGKVHDTPLKRKGKRRWLLQTRSTALGV